MQYFIITDLSQNFIFKSTSMMPLYEWIKVGQTSGYYFDISTVILAECDVPKLFFIMWAPAPRE